MGKLYGMGAAVVIVGALFKIQHWPGAGMMLTIGLSTEAIIFFFSSFEPPHEEVDWSLVYPELAGLHGEDEEALAEDPRLAQKKSALEKFDEMINEAEISPELFKNLGQGLNSLKDTTSQLSDLSSATVVTNDYVDNVKKASDSMSDFSESYNSSVGKLNDSANTLSDSYSKTSDLVAQSGNDLANAYGKLTETMSKEQDSALEGNKSYGEQLEYMTKNLTALNSVYELQLQGSSEHLEAAKELYSGLDDMMRNLKESANDVEKYKQEVSKLGNNLSALNTVYGNMLTAMNVNTNA